MTLRGTSGCVIPDCGKPVEARGWCDMHYRRYRRTGDPLGSLRRPTERIETDYAPGLATLARIIMEETAGA